MRVLLSGAYHTLLWDYKICRISNIWQLSLIYRYYQQKPNILILWGDDIGWWNISYNSRGQMGYRTPNIDRLAEEGIRVYEICPGVIASDMTAPVQAKYDKLIADGYDIKGHSSTVDEETAAKIRQTMLKEPKTELVEKRIDSEQGATATA